jgi:hypothetical protein
MVVDDYAAPGAACARYAPFYSDKIGRCILSDCFWQWEPTLLLPGALADGLRKPTSGPTRRLFPSPIQVLPIVVRPPLLRLCWADGSSSAQLTIPVMSPHSQRVHGEDARKAGRTADHRLLQGGTARRGEQHSTDKSCKQHAASAWQAIPLESIRLLALLRCHMRR